QPLGTVVEADCPWERDITALLRERNELVVMLEASSDAGGLWGEVALEIRRTAFVRRVRAGRSTAADSVYLSVAGEVVGSSGRPLELYALSGGKTIAYQTVEPHPEGRRFLLRGKADEPPSSSSSTDATVRLELIDGGVIWYAVETPILATLDDFEFTPMVL